jgi:hypothetical protein
MPRVQTAIPRRFRDLIDQSSAAGAALELAASCDQILGDNEMPFFPAYTDHGASHVGSVLEAAERLIPAAVWKQGLLTPEDAVVLTAATFLHDLGMHVREPGFLALVAEDSRRKPLPWFGEDQRGRPADVPWPELWQDFRREARRFSQSQLDRILGPEYGDQPQIVFGEHYADPSEWTLNDRLLVGEFLRRHHARLAHEIAIHGLPGIARRDFPVLGKSLPALAEAIGATARSHNEDMRIASDYLESRGKGDLRPDGVAQLYLMGVLRISDYFQVQASRASPLLLHLREPQSPASVAEWKKQQAITKISWEHKDPHAVSVQISPAHGLRTHLQLAELVADLQGELDRTAAVLSETYGATKLSALQLSLQRVRTNLHEPDLHRRLSFVPRRASMRSAEDLFRLVVDDLYGNEPAVAGRELLQNAVDAVRERERWEALRGERLDGTSFRSQEADVVVEVREVDDQIGLLRISDRGIGMSVSTVIESFLTAGATFSPSTVEADWEERSPIKWMKAGRFGIGVFAAFLLGNLIQATTRHPGEEKGITFLTRMDDDLVQLDWDEDAPLGTEIVVPYHNGVLPEGRRWLRKDQDENRERHRDLLSQIQQFFVLGKPLVEFRFTDQGGSCEVTQAPAEVPDPKGKLPDPWRSVAHPDFDAILWSLPSRTLAGSTFAPWGGNHNEIAHNGILIRRPRRGEEDGAYQWASSDTKEILKPPSLAIFDTGQRLRLALNRYELASSSLPFEDELLQSIGYDVLAHALVCGEAAHPLAGAWGTRPIFGRKHWLPLIPGLVHKHIDRDLCILLIDSPERDELATRFLKGQTKGGHWRQLPYRTALQPVEIFSDEELEELEWKDDDSVRRDHAEKEATRSIDEFTRLFHFWPTAGVLVRPSAPNAITKLYGNSGDPDESRGELLAAIGKELSETCDVYVDSFALVLLGATDPYEYEDEDEDEEYAPGSDFEEPLAEPWEEILGGMLERGPKAREKRRQEITGKNRQMRDLVERWERFSKTPKWP